MGEAHCMGMVVKSWEVSRGWGEGCINHDRVKITYDAGNKDRTAGKKKKCMFSVSQSQIGPGR